MQENMWFQRQKKFIWSSIICLILTSIFHHSIIRIINFSIFMKVLMTALAIIIIFLSMALYFLNYIKLNKLFHLIVSSIFCIVGITCGIDYLLIFREEIYKEIYKLNILDILILIFFLGIILILSVMIIISVSYLLSGKIVRIEGSLKDVLLHV